MRAFAFYVCLSLAAIWVIGFVGGSVYGAAGEAAFTMLGMGAWMAFDTKVASTEWSVLRRILPNVSWLDAVAVSAPYAIVALLLVAGSTDASLTVFLVALFAAPMFTALFLLVRWERMRRGSKDDFKWIRAPSLTWKERFSLYLSK